MTTRLDVIEARLGVLEQRPGDHDCSGLEARVAALEAGHALRAFNDDEGRLFLQVGTARPVRVPGFCFRGPWRPNGTYQRGDTVQWGGDLWVAVQDGPVRQPGVGAGTETGWRMAVRRGRPGKSSTATAAAESQE
jgi:hypothetical protein